MQRRSNNQPLYKPEFWEKVQFLDENGNKEDSNFHCMPAGVPRMGPPNKIVQTPTEVILMYNAKNAYRIIPTDGRPHDKINSEDQTFMGDSIGAWEGDTLVVDVVGFNDTSWLGWPGGPPFEPHARNRTPAPRRKDAPLPGDGGGPRRADGAMGHEPAHAAARCQAAAAD